MNATIVRLLTAVVLLPGPAQAQSSVSFDRTDTSLGIRISGAFPGKRWLYQPAARVHHKVAAGRATFGYLLKRSFEEGEGKAALAASVGAEAGLESERRHLFVTVPLGFLRGFGELLRGDPYGPARSVALVAGVGAAAAGYLVASLRSRLHRDMTPEPI